MCQCARGDQGAKCGNMPPASAAQGEHVQFVLLPLFGEPGTDASKSKFGDVCELLKSGFTDPYGEASWRGSSSCMHTDTEQCATVENLAMSAQRTYVQPPACCTRPASRDPQVVTRLVAAGCTNAD